MNKRTKDTTHKKHRKSAVWRRIGISSTIILFGTLCGIYLFCNVMLPDRQKKQVQPDTTAKITEASSDAATTEETTEPEPEFSPHAVKSTKPGTYLKATQINVDDVTLSKLSDYQPARSISFGLPENYTNAKGIVTFRGNNFRDDPTYGCTDMTQEKLEQIWTQQTGSLSYQGATWSGSGWTGQPLVMSWPKEVRAHMDLFDWAKEKDELVEVIYACMDGNIYFNDLYTGKSTRNTMHLGFTFKGSGALDPRGYPILYVGAGYAGTGGHARVFVINLLTNSVMYTFGNDDSFSMRGNLSYFDSSALVDAATDTLIYPGENGVLYLIHLGTEYDAEAGTLSIAPDHVVKWHYQNKRGTREKYWLGMEDSALIYKEYLFIMDNGGDMFCLNLNTLTTVWEQDCLDDSNGSAVLSIEDGKLYLYASTSFHLGWRSSTTAPVPIWKIDAETGEILWQTEYTCQSMEELSGGTQSSLAIGKNSLSPYLYVTVSRTGGMYNGVLSCISKENGAVMWEHKSAYTWSSPVCTYDKDGNGNVLYCNSEGYLYLLDGITGEQKDSLRISDGCIEASPVVYDNNLVVGTRGCRIVGVKLK